MQLPTNLVPERLGPYVLGKRLGGGGMGDVYEASHILMTSRRVAIKLLKPHLAENPQFVQRFLREISALGSIKAHANLVRAEFADLAQNVPYLVMEYVEGVDLDQMLKKHGPFSVCDACNIICQAAAGLEEIHQAGMVHRDLKPSNLMLATDGVVKILDLGLARLQMTEGGSDELTGTNCFLGTVDYTAPEQADDPRSVDIRADIYSLGCTIYKLLTGRAPFAEYSTVVQKIRAHATVSFPGLPADVPLELQQLVGKMVAKSPADRVGSPKELATALRPFCQGSTLQPALTVAARPSLDEVTRDSPLNGTQSTAASPAPIASSAVQAKPAPWSRRTKVMTIASVIALAGLVALAAAVVRWRPADEPREPRELRNMDEFATSKRHPLLDQEPTPLIWYQADGASSTKFDAERKMFTVFSPKQALFGLGALQKKADFTFQVTIVNSPLEHTGIFWGFRTTDLKPNEKACFQSLAFEGVKDGFRLKRARCTIIKAAGFDEYRYDSSAVADVPNPQAEMVLEITVRRRALVAVKLNGVAYEELTHSAVNGDYQEADYRGAFGTFTASYGCLFKEPTLYLPPADN